jgi:hypothetical protein
LFTGKVVPFFENGHHLFVFFTEAIFFAQTGPDHERIVNVELSPSLSHRRDFRGFMEFINPLNVK